MWDLRCRDCGAHGAHLAADGLLFSVFLVLLPPNFVQRHINISKPLHGKATSPPYGGETLYPPSVERSSYLKRFVSSCQFKVKPSVDASPAVVVVDSLYVARATWQTQYTRHSSNLVCSLTSTRPKSSAREGPRRLLNQFKSFTKSSPSGSEDKEHADKPHARLLGFLHHAPTRRWRQTMSLGNAVWRRGHDSLFFGGCGGNL